MVLKCVTEDKILLNATGVVSVVSDTIRGTRFYKNHSKGMSI